MSPLPRHRRWLDGAEEEWLLRLSSGLASEAGLDEAIEQHHLSGLSRIPHGLDTCADVGGSR